MESNDTPKVPDRMWKTSNIPGLPSGSVCVGGRGEAYQDETRITKLFK